MAGERILVTVPMENLFNTPLVLKRSFLLWKFTPGDQETSGVSNDKQAETMSSAGLIQAEVLDSVTVERGQVTQVTYAITANRKGTLNILGLGRLRFLYLKKFGHLFVVGLQCQGWTLLIFNISMQVQVQWYLLDHAVH